MNDPIIKTNFKIATNNKSFLYIIELAEGRRKLGGI